MSVGARRQHADDLYEAWFIGFEGVGVGDRLIYFGREGWLRRSVHPAIRDLVARTAEAHPNQKIETRAISGNSVVATPLWRGCKSACLSVYEFCQAEIQNFDLATIGNEDVCRFDIPMDDSLHMSSIKRIGNLHA